MRTNFLVSPLFAGLFSAVATTALLPGPVGAQDRAPAGAGGGGQQMCPQGKCPGGGGMGEGGAAARQGGEQVAPGAGAKQPAGESAQQLQTPSETQQGGGQAGEQPQREQAQGEQGGGQAGEQPQRQQAQDQQRDAGPVTTGAINLSSEQETTIRRTLVDRDVERVTDIDVDLNIGVRIPQTVQLHPLPAEIVRIVPDYEGYVYFIMADGTIVIVDPDALTIVYVLTG